MIIELGKIHVKWKLLIKSTCMLLPNENVTVWIRILLGVCSLVINKGGTKLYGRDRLCEANVKTETVKPIITKIDLGTSTWPTLLRYSS
jgi:hypothetical protein